MKTKEVLRSFYGDQSVWTQEAFCMDGTSHLQNRKFSINHEKPFYNRLFPNVDKKEVRR